MQIVDRPPSLLQLAGQTWRDKRLLPKLGTRVMVKGFAGMRLGRGWLVIRPALDLGAKALLFGAVFNAPSEGVPYFVFLLAGMLCWQLFQNGLIFGARSPQFYRRHFRSLDFSLLLIPVAGTAIGLLDFAVYAAILAGVLAYYALAEGQAFLNLGPELLLAVAAVVLTAAMVWGLCFFLSVFYARVQDVKPALRYVIQAWLFITPVVYPLSFVPEGLRWVALANPLTPLVEMFRYGLLGVGSIPMASLYASLATIAILLVSGAWFYNRQIRSAMAMLNRNLGEDEEDLLV